MYPTQHVGDISSFPANTYWPSGTWIDSWSPGHTGSEGVFTSPNPYKDHQLGEMEGIFGDIWGGIKSVGGAVYNVGKSVVTAIPAAATGLVTGGIPAAIAAGGAKAVSTFLNKSPQEQERIRQQLTLNEVEAAVPSYQTVQYPDSIQNAAQQVYNQARGELLRRGGEAIARTPEGRAAISSTVQRDIWSGLQPALPFIAIGAALLLLRK